MYFTHYHSALLGQSLTTPACTSLLHSPYTVYYYLLWVTKECVLYCSPVWKIRCFIHVYVSVCSHFFLQCVFPLLYSSPGRNLHVTEVLQLLLILQKKKKNYCQTQVLTKKYKKYALLNMCMHTCVQNEFNYK